MSSLPETVNVDGSIFQSNPHDNFSSLINLTYSTSEQGHIVSILSSFIGRYHATITQFLADAAQDNMAEFDEISHRAEMILLLERLHTKPKLVLSIFKLSPFESMVNLMEAKHAV